MEFFCLDLICWTWKSMCIFSYFKCTLFECVFRQIFHVIPNKVFVYSCILKELLIFEILLLMFVCFHAVIVLFVISYVYFWAPKNVYEKNYVKRTGSWMCWNCDSWVFKCAKMSIFQSHFMLLNIANSFIHLYWMLNITLFLTCIK